MDPHSIILCPKSGCPTRGQVTDEIPRDNDLYDPPRWGLSLEAIRGLGQRLYEFWQRYADCFRSPTRNEGHYAYHYLSGLLRMESQRNFSEIGRRTGVPGQNVQHFMSNSPWPAPSVIAQVQDELVATPGLSPDGMLLLDESADVKAGAHSAGAGRQYNGRVGSVQMSQVGTFLAYGNGPLWTWIDGELFLPEHWFRDEMADERQRLGIPQDRSFATKIELGWKMIQRVQARGLPFVAVGCDTLYGRSVWLRRKMAGANILYMAEVPADTQVYLRKPKVGVPKKKPGSRRGYTRARVLSKTQPVEVRVVAQRKDTIWQRVRVRATERGELNDEFAVRQVWTTHHGELPVQEWLVMRRTSDGDITYALSNAPANTPLERLAWLKCQRWFIERANQDAKSETGWDEFQAQKYRAWQHQLALTILATWFIAQTKWEWAQQHARDPQLLSQLEVDVLPALSAANVRALLRAAMPLPRLTPEAAADLVVEHLVNRMRARKSRMRSRHKLNRSP